MTDEERERLDTRAHLLFWKLKETLAEIEAAGRRPMVITHPNGMLDSFGVYPAHPTTPQVDAIRAKKRELAITHAA